MMAEIKKLNVSQVAEALQEPFSMVNVALVGDIVVSIYICQGTLRWHRHLDSDELFWVHEGAILLESERGEVWLQPGEMAVVPKGVGHRSGSELRAVVLLLRASAVSDEGNGRHHLYSLDAEPELKQAGILEAAQSIRMPFEFQTIARIEESRVQVAWGEGTWPVETPTPRDVFLMLARGAAAVSTPDSTLHLQPGDLTAVPQGTVYTLSSDRETVLARVMQEGGS